MSWLRAAVLLLAPALCGAATQLLVTVVDAKSGESITDLKAADFAISDAGAAKTIEAAEYKTGPVDTMLLVDSSLVGHMVQPLAASLIAELGEKEQMGLVAYHSSPDLVQDFTSSKQTLLDAVSRIKFGNDPRVLDAVYATADGGFQSATYRRVILLLTAGLEGNSRVTDKAVVKMCRKNGVSVFPVYASGSERGMMRMLAEQTGGASFSIRDLGKATEKPGKRIFEAIRGHYIVTLKGNLALSEKLKVTLTSPRKVLVSALPLD